MKCGLSEDGTCQQITQTTSNMRLATHLPSPAAASCSGAGQSSDLSGTESRSACSSAQSELACCRQEPLISSSTSPGTAAGCSASQQGE